jgi:hypothetical protein
MEYFVTIGDTSYFKFIALSVDNILIYHPQAQTIVYDWGFTSAQKRNLMQYKNVQVIPWSFIKNPFPCDFTIANRKEWLLAQKPYCFLDFALQYHSPFVFLDGDAYLINNISELFDDDFDIAITLRRPGEREFTKGKCRVVNSGVFALNDLTIIDKWIARMQITDERLVEQTALTRLLYEEGLNVKIKELSCEQYNFYWINRHIPSDVKIIHYKGKGVKDCNRHKKLVK